MLKNLKPHSRFLFQNLDFCKRSSVASASPQNTDEESTSKIAEEYEPVDKVRKVRTACYAKLFITISYLYGLYIHGKYTQKGG